MDVTFAVGLVERAVEYRGTAMLSVRGDQRRWGAFCAAVDGSLELRLGEPRRRWRRWSVAPAEEWLESHGFVQVVDAWAAPVAPQRTVYAAAETVLVGIRDALGADHDAELVEVLFHPGVLDPATAPEPTAPREVHIRHALSSLAAHGRGKLSVHGGRPAETWAWAFVTDEGLVLEPEPPEPTGDYEDDWTVEVDAEAATEAGEHLTALLQNDYGRPTDAPLFISFMDLGPAARRAPRR